jgi:hypothetical protein
MLRSTALDSETDKLNRFFVNRSAQVFLLPFDQLGFFGIKFLIQPAQQYLPGFFKGQRGYFLQALFFFRHKDMQLVFLDLEGFFDLTHIVLPGLDILLFLFQKIVPAVYILFLLGQALFHIRDLLAPVLGLLFKLLSHTVQKIFGFQFSRAQAGFRVLLRLVDYGTRFNLGFPGFLLGKIPAHEISQEKRDQSGRCDE